MTDPNAELFREVARFIDEVDQEVADCNERKKDFWQDMRQRMAPSDVRALQGAIRIRRKRRKDPDAFDALDWRTDEILQLITEENPEIGHAHERTREAIPYPHDLNTGELTEPPEPTAVPAQVQAADVEPHPPSAAEFPELPAALDRRRAA